MSFEEQAMIITSMLIGCILLLIFAAATLLFGFDCCKQVRKLKKSVCGKEKEKKEEEVEKEIDQHREKIRKDDVLLDTWRN